MTIYDRTIKVCIFPRPSLAGAFAPFTFAS
jgi:hypothetical protein